MLEEEKSGEAQKSGREKQPRALLAPCTFEISRPEQHSVMKMKSVEVGGAPGMEFDVDVDVEGGYRKPHLARKFECALG